MSQPTDLFPVADDDALSVHSDFSEASEMVSAVLCRNSFFFPELNVSLYLSVSVTCYP